MKLDLNKYETLVYECLLEYGKLTAKDISKYSEVPPTAVYPALKTLEEKGLINKLMAEVGIYETVDPKISIPAYLDRKAKEIKDSKEDIVKSYMDMKGKKDAYQEIEPVSVTKGLETSQNIFRELGEKSSKSIDVVGWRFSRTSTVYELKHKVDRFAKKGVKIRIIAVNKSEKLSKFLEIVKSKNIEVRYLPLKNFSLTIWDKTNCKITIKSGERVNLKIDDSDLSEAFSDYFEVLWKRAERLQNN